MKNLKYILPLIAILSLSKDKQCLAQNFSEEEQHQLDSLNAIINNTASHDTSLAGAYVGLSDILYVSNLDTIIPLCTKAQQLAEKSLSTQPSTAITHSLKTTLADAINNIGYTYDNQGDRTKALEYYHRSLQLREEIGNKAGIASSLNNIGVTYNAQGDNSKALEYYHRSLQLREEIGNKARIATSLNNIGYIYKNQGDIAKALEYYHRSLQLYQELGNKVGIALSLNNIGTIYNTQGDNSKALEYFRRSLQLREEIGNKAGIASSLNNIGYTYDNQGDIAKALEYFRRSLQLREEIGNKARIAMSLNNIGVIYVDQGDIAKALEYFRRSLQLREEIGNKAGITMSLNNIGVLELRAGALAAAERSLTRGLKVAQEIGFPRWISKNSSNLSRLFKQQHRYAAALTMYELHIQMRDSINNETTQKAAIQQETKYEYEKVQAVKDKAHEKQLEIEKEAKEKQQVITYATAGGLGLVVVFLIFVFNRLQVTKKQKLVIEGQKEEVEEAHKEITDSINYAERIQRSFLATKDMLDTNLKDYFVFFKPKDVVSGDFYWAGHLQNGNFAVVNADSTGHGVPGAIMSILNISSIEKAIEQGENKPSEIFNQTRNTIIERLKKDGSKEGGKDGMDASIICFDFANNKFTYTAANNPIWVIRNNEVTIIKPDKMPVGKHDNDSTSFSQGEFEFKKGDQIYTLTDGFQDQFGGPKGKKFMVKKMRDYLLSISHLPMKEQHEKLNEVFTNWKGEHEQVDDVCVIGVRI